MPDTPHDLTEALIAAARAAGAESADAVAIRGESVIVDIRSGTLEQAERAEGTDIGLRVLIGGRQANVSGSDTRPETIAALAERAVAMAREAPEDPHAGLADPASSRRPRDAAGLELCDPANAPAPETLMRMAQEAEAAALGVDGVSQVQSASAAWSHRDMHIAASNGFSGGYARTDTSLSCAAIAGHRHGHGARRRRRQPRVSRRSARPRGYRRSAGRRAAERIGARRPPTGRVPRALRRAGGGHAHRPSARGRQRGVGGARGVVAARPARHGRAARRARPARGPAPPARLRLAPLRRRGAGDRAARHRRGRGAARLRARSRLRAQARHGVDGQRRARRLRAALAATWNVALTQGSAAATRCCARWAPGCWSPR